MANKLVPWHRPPARSCAVQYNTPSQRHLIAATPHRGNTYVHDPPDIFEVLQKYLIQFSNRSWIDKMTEKMFAMPVQMEMEAMQDGNDAPLPRQPHYCLSLGFAPCRTLRNTMHCGRVDIMFRIKWKKFIR